MTSDGWKSPLSSHAHWFSITVHWIDKDFNLRHVLFDLYNAELHSTADVILRQWMTHLQPLNVNYTPFGIVTDGDAATHNARVALCTNLDMRGIWCVCHRLNLVSKYIVAIEEVQVPYNKCKKIQKMAKKSSVFAGIFQNLKQKKTIQLCSASEIRWNSAFNMFKSFLVNQSALEQTLEQTNYPPRKRLNAQDWSSMTMANEILGIIKPEIQFFQAENETTISSVFPRLLFTKDLIRQLSPDNKIADEADAELVHYFPWLSSWDPPSPEFTTFSSASFLDPRYKDFFFISDPRKREQLLQSLLPALAEILPPSGTTDVPNNAKESPVMIHMRQQSRIAERRTEVERYIGIARDTDISEDPLKFWRQVKRNDFPTLSQVARRVLSLPASSATSERAFSAANAVLSKSRTRLSSVSSRSACMITVNKSLLSSIRELPSLSPDQITAFFAEEEDGEEEEEGEEEANE